MAKVTFKNIYKMYSGDVVAVKDFNLEIQDKEFIVLVGPSGCGKSTSLRMVAGLEDITEGEIYIGDILVNEVPPKDRDIAMVFQNYALYPHMTVYDNMAFGLKLKKLKTEAMTMGDRIVIMKDGVIQQAASPKEVYEHPANVFVGGFIGSPQMNFINAKVEGNKEGCQLVFGHVNIKLPKEKVEALINGDYIGKEIIIGIRPEDIYCVNKFDEASVNNIIEAKVDISEMLGAEIYLYLNIEDNYVIVRVDRKESYNTNDIVKLYFDENRVHLFDKNTEVAII